MVRVCCVLSASFMLFIIYIKSMKCLSLMKYINLSKKENKTFDHLLTVRYHEIFCNDNLVKP